MKIEKWWKCRGCNLAYKSFLKAGKCHPWKGLDRIGILIDDDGKPISAPTKKEWRSNTDEDDTFGLMSDLLGEI